MEFGRFYKDYDKLDQYQNPNFEDIYFKNIVDKKDYIINK